MKHLNTKYFFGKCPMIWYSFCLSLFHFHIVRYISPNIVIAYFSYNCYERFWRELWQSIDIPLIVFVCNLKKASMTYRPHRNLDKSAKVKFIASISCVLVFNVWSTLMCVYNGQRQHLCHLLFGARGLKYQLIRITLYNF